MKYQFSMNSYEIQLRPDIEFSLRAFSGSTNVFSTEFPQMRKKKLFKYARSVDEKDQNDTLRRTRERFMER